MANRILLVDDDEALLRSIARNLLGDFDVRTAEGGEAALQALESDGPFSVAVVDMRMPKMDGIQTITALRPRAKQTVFVMLTGNQDLDTAMQAVNEGQVFRFLTKPAEMADLKAAVNAAQGQHNLLTAEKDLLNGTFLAAVNLMANLIENQGYRMVDTNRMSDAIAELACELGYQISWEELVAARVFLIGLAEMDAADVRDFDLLDPETEEHQALLARICNSSARMIGKIPRMEWIAETLNDDPKFQRLDDIARAERKGSRVAARLFLLELDHHEGFRGG